MENVTITKKEYEDLVDSQTKLRALENAGVDNWEGYDYAMEEMNQDLPRRQLDALVGRFCP